MADIFISYSSKYRELTSKLAERLIAEGYTVWWDHELESWASYETQIRAALAEARVVVVVWSDGAATSDWVYSEAKAANSAGKLVNALPNGLPYSLVRSPFDAHHIDILDLDEPYRLLRSIRGAWEGRPGSRAKPLHESYQEDYGVDLFDTKRSPLPRAAEDLGPSDLLQARHEAVEYIRGTGHLEEILAWCRDPARRTIGRLIHGAGGFGKTRLMIEAARLLRAESWLAGFLPLPPESVDKEREARARRQALEQVFALGDEPGVLLVIDYAEGRQGEARELARLMARRPAEATRPVRLVLLARGADWWREFYADLGGGEPVFRVPGQPHGNVEAITTIPEGQQRLDFFVASVAAFAPHMKRMAETGSFPGWDGRQPDQARLQRLMTEPSFARPLALQMEAMLFLASASPEPGATGVDALLGRILDLEQAHWQKLLGPLAPERRRDLVRGVAQVTAVQGVRETDGAQCLLQADGFYKGRRSAAVDVDRVLDDLQRLYGRTGGGLAHLEPDLVGEHHVAGIDKNPMALIEGCLSWVNEQPEEMRGNLRQTLLTVLQRATQPEHGVVGKQAEALLDDLVRKHCQTLAAPLVAVMLNTPGALIERVEAALPQLNLVEVLDLNEALPRKSVTLRVLAYATAKRMVELARDVVEQFGRSNADQKLEAAAWLALSLYTLGVRASGLGRRDEALAATTEAVDAYRALPKANRNAHLPNLAMSLNGLAAMLSGLGRRDEALGASSEAVDAYRILARTNPDAFLPDLAMSLNSFGAMLSEVGRREEALARSAEAVDICRGLATVNSDNYLHGLASSLSGFSNRLSDVGRRKEALVASVEAADAYRALVRANSDAFLPDLAISLTNLGSDLVRLGRRDEALDVISEAIDAYRTLARTNPDAFLPNLATGLNNIGFVLSDLGRRDEALAASVEAVDILRALIKVNSGAFLPDLATSLNNLGSDLSDLGRREEALAVTSEAVDIRRALAKVNADAFLPDLAVSLNNFGAMLSDLGRREEALAASVEAVGIHRTRAKAESNAFLPDLAQSLYNLASDLSDVGRQDEAVAVGAEAVDAYRSLAKVYPDDFLPKLADGLHNLAAYLSGLGYHDEAVAASSEAVDAYRALAKASPGDFLPTLAKSLNSLGLDLARLGRHEEALVASAEAADVSEALAKSDVPNQ